MYHNQWKSLGINSILIAMIFIMAGCATKKAEQTGFLKDYSNFSESKIVPGLMVDKHSTKGLEHYSKFIIKPVTVQFHSKAKGKEVEPEKLEEMADFVYEELSAALENNGFPVVQDPGEGVLEIHVAITDIIASKAYLNLHWSTTMTKAGIGGASMEADFRDSVTDERILAVIDTQNGKTFQMNIIKGYTRGWTKWGHTEYVFKQWIELLINRLNELHGKA